MIRFAPIFVALSLAAAGSTALAAQPSKSAPMQMTDAQMDDVTAGLLTIVFQDSFNDWTINLGDAGANGTGKAPHPGNGHAKGLEQGKGNPHQAGSASNGGSSGKPGSMTFILNIAANVNAAIAGGDATATQTVGTQTQTYTVTSQMLAASRK